MAMTHLFPIVNGMMPAVLEFLPVLLIGVLFGMALEVSGFGNSRILASQFYFHDMRVFKVMFTSIITASAGVAIFKSLGLLDLDLVYVPSTFIVPHLVGGFILGVGFMISAYCPGTSIVATASGKIDGLLTFTGVIIGAVLFGMVEPSVKSFYMSTAKGVLTFPKLLGVSYAVLSALLVAGAFLLFLGADKLETVFAGKLNMPEGEKMSGRAKKIFGAVFSIAVLAVILPHVLPADRQADQVKQATPIGPVELAKMLIDNPRSLNVVDLREKECKGKEIIPQAVCYNDIKDNIEFMYKGNTLVVYSQNGKDPLPAGIFKFKGKINVLAGGYDAWQATVLGKPEAAYQAILDHADDNAKKMIVAIHDYYTTAKVATPSANKAPVNVMRPKMRSGGCQ